MARSVTRSMAVGIAPLAMLAAPSPAAADRAEVVNPARAYAAPSCPITPDAAATKELDDGVKELGPLLGGLLAGLVGNVIKEGATALGDALEQASQEKGIVAEGTTFFRSTTIAESAGPPRTAVTTARPACLVLYIPGEGDLEAIGADAALAAALQPASGLGVNPLNRATGPAGGESPYRKMLGRLGKAGLTTMPALYVEARVVPLDEGFVIRPVLAWYARRLPRAPSGQAATELHVSLATPGASDIGTTFGAARLILPRMAPGDLVAWPALRASASVVIAPRPTAGFVDTRVTAMNAAYALASTREQELRVAQRAFDAATRKNQAASTAETQATLAVARVARDDAQRAREDARNAAGGFPSTAAGVINAKVRFVVVRDANQFGLAIAKALKGQAEAAGKAVTTALTPAAPEPAFTANDTAYATALAAVSSKQREYDAALASGDAAAAAKAGDELFVLKAKLNEAAVASRRQIPYPTLLQ